MRTIYIYSEEVFICMKKLVVIALLMMGLLTVQTAQAEEEIIVSAAASLTGALTAAGQKFEQANPEIKVVFNFASSGSLLQQMIQGAPVDVFASADQKSMDDAQEKKLISPESRKNFVQNKLVLAVPADSKLNIKEIADLALPEVKRISLGNPESVPAGRYARESLTNYGLWEKLADKFIYANAVTQVLDYLRRGEVDAGFVFLTDAKIAQDKVKVIMEVPKHKAVIYPIAVLDASKKKESAKRFVDFILSDKGMEIFVQFGFGKP